MPLAYNPWPELSPLTWWASQKRHQSEIGTEQWCHLEVSRQSPPKSVPESTNRSIRNLYNKFTLLYPPLSHNQANTLSHSGKTMVLFKAKLYLLNFWDRVLHTKASSVNSWSFSFYILNAGVTGLYYHTQFVGFFVFFFNDFPLTFFFTVNSFKPPITHKQICCKLFYWEHRKASIKHK